MLRNIMGVQDGTTRGTGIVISDDETAASVIDLTADSSDDESSNAGAPPTAAKTPGVPSKRCTKCTAWSPIRAQQCTKCDERFPLKPPSSVGSSAGAAGPSVSSSICDNVKNNGRKRKPVDYREKGDAEFMEGYCAICCRKAPIMGPNGPRGEWRGDRFIYRGCYMNCPCKCHEDAA